MVVVGNGDYSVTSYLFWSYGFTSADEKGGPVFIDTGARTPISASGILSGLHSASGLQQHFSVQVYTT